MSFLPFVLSFLLILVLASGTLFQSFRSTQIEKRIILAQNRARLELISLQEKRKIDQLRKSEKAPVSTTLPSTKKPKRYQDVRHQRKGYESSKLNLSILWNKSDPMLYRMVYETAVRLLERLYQEADFYREAKDPHLAQTLLNALIEKKGERFIDLFPSDPKLSKIYYKMLKGTNTGYPSLEEYFTLTSIGNQPPVRFRYASALLLEAVLGKRAAEEMMKEEKEPGHSGVLTQEELRSFLQKHSTLHFSTNEIFSLLSFDPKDKGDPHAFCDPQTQIRVER